MVSNTTRNVYVNSIVNRDISQYALLKEGRQWRLFTMAFKYKWNVEDHKIKALRSIIQRVAKDRSVRKVRWSRSVYYVDWVYCLIPELIEIEKISTDLSLFRNTERNVINVDMKNIERDFCKKSVRNQKKARYTSFLIKPRDGNKTPIT